MRPVLFAALVALLLYAFLPRRETAPSSPEMSTLTKPKPRTSRPLAKSPAAVRARRRRAEDKADYELAAKRCAEIDSGKSKLHSREEVMRELGLSV